MKFVGLDVRLQFFPLETNPFGERLPKEFVKKIKIWHVLCGITIWMERKDGVFNQGQWHESKVKHLNWDDCIIYAKLAWARVVKFGKISAY